MIIFLNYKRLRAPINLLLDCVIPGRGNSLPLKLSVSAILQAENESAPSEHMAGANGGKKSYTLFQGHSGPVYSASFSPLGDFILSSSSDSTSTFCFFACQKPFVFLSSSVFYISG